MQMIYEYNAKRFCCEDISNIENYDKAIADNTQTWDLHHRKEIAEHKTRKQLIEEDLYFNRPTDELIFLTKSEHQQLHNRGKQYSDETREKLSKSISAAMRGRKLSAETREKLRATFSGDKNPMFGKHPSEAAREKMRKAVSEAMKKYWA